MSIPFLVSLSIIAFLTNASADRYIESIAANVDSLHSSSKAQQKHENFIPLVAFKCGYRNKFLNKKGEWQDDPSSAAQCLHGKFNTLKYCRRVYPDLADKINNIVEYSHVSRIDNWGKEDGSDCHSKFTLRPFRCMVGEFVTEALQVPNKCHFSHIAGKNQCNDYNYWSGEAEKQCAAKFEERSKQPLRLHSFSILEPCGIDMWRGVEYVCCPKSVEERIENIVDLKDDDDTDQDDEDDYSDEDAAEDDDESSTQKSSVSDQQDPYFKENQNANEHDRFRDAMERLERKHRKRVTKVITQWSELFERYNKMKEKDQKGAENYKREMTAKFRKTVSALEEENKEQRKQIEEVHNERVQASLNEKKRQATHDYRAALALQVGTDNKESVLQTLKAYIKAEEKDRTHMLNRYRHLLRTDPESAMQFEPVLLHRLRYIDLRINGTLAMLRDFPLLEKEIRPTAEKFWKDYRHENTPEGAESEGYGSRYLSEDERNERLIKFYKKTFEKDQSESDTLLVDPKEETTLGERKPTITTTSKPSTTKKMVALKDVLTEKDDADSDEDQFEDDDDDRPILASTKNTPKGADSPIEFVKDTVEKKEKPLVKVPIKVKAVKSKVVEEISESDDKDESEEDDSDEAESSYIEFNKKGEERELHIAVEPIQLAKEEIEEEMRERSYLNRWISQTNLFIAMMGLAILTLFIIIRRRNRRRGFIEVEIHNPEDKHVNAMQVNGYENPTYAFYEKQP